MNLTNVFTCMLKNKFLFRSLSDSGRLLGQNWMMFRIVHEFSNADKKPFIFSGHQQLASRRETVSINNVILASLSIVKFFCLPLPTLSRETFLGHGLQSQRQCYGSLWKSNMILVLARFTRRRFCWHQSITCWIMWITHTETLNFVCTYFHHLFTAELNPGVSIFFWASILY